MSESLWPTIEYEYGYPGDESFEAFNHFPMSLKAAGEWLLRELPKACQYMCCSCRIRRGKTIAGKPAYLIDFSTGGWSGAESIMHLIERRADLRLLKLQWRRGGHYIFEVQIPADKRSASDIRKQAWETRRRKYGQSGHSGSYSQ